jgi:hypothetical protein
MQKAGQNTLGFSKNFKAAAGISALVVSGMAAAGAAVNRVIQDFAALADEIGKASKRAQISTDDFQSLGFAMEQSGGSTKQLETAFKTVAAQLYELDRGSTTAADLFKEVKLSAEDLSGLSVGDQFRKIAKGLLNITDLQKRAAVAQKIFGRSGTSLLPLLGNMDELEKRFKKLGLTIDAEAIAAGEQLTDMNNELKRSFEKLASEFVSELLPAIIIITTALREMNRSLSTMLSVSGQIVKGGFLRQIPLIGSYLDAGARITKAMAEAMAGGRLDDIKDKIPDLPESDMGGTKRSRIDPEFDSIINNLDRQIASQREVVRALREQNNRLAPLPQALQKGTTAQLSFVAQLQRDKQQAKIDAREKKKIDLQEKQLKELEELRRLREREIGIENEVNIV